MSPNEQTRDQLWVWSNLVEAVRALDAVIDCLPPDEDERAWELFRQAERLRADVELRVFNTLGLSGALPATDLGPYAAGQ